MKALIIGAAGFVGSYLTDHLQNECKWSVSVTKMENEVIQSSTAEIFNLNILNKDEIYKVLNKTNPDYIFHLAAQSSVALSWKNPNLTIDVNIKGTINLLDSIRELDCKPKVLLIGSGEEYGNINPNETPICENTILRPGNIYAVTKATQNMIGKIYCDAYKMNIVMVRAFNHIGPKQSPIFVVSDFCKQVAEIESGIKEPVISVGNLTAKRDFTDVRDVVKAYSALMQKSENGITYNVGSGKAVSIKQILELILKMSTVKINVVVDNNKFRPVDVPIIEADCGKITNETGWKPQISLENTIKDTLNYWRNEVL